MVGYDVHNYPHIVFVRFVTHRSEFIARAKLVIAYFKIGWLIVVIPLAVAVQLHSAVLTL